MMSLETHSLWFRELLANLEHQQWAHWTKYMLDVLDLDSLNDPRVNHWRKLIETPYEELTETQKESDREWADKIIEVLEEYGLIS